MNKFQANICLLTSTLCWAPEVILFKRFPAGIPAFAVISLSTGLGALILLAVLWTHLRRRPSWSSLWRIGVLAVLAMTQNTLGVVGSRQLSVSTSMFVLSLYVVGVPLVLTLSRRMPPLRNWVGVAVIMVGMALAVQLGSGGARLGPLLILLISTIVDSFYLVGINDTSRICDPAELTVYLLALVSLLSFGGWVISDPGSVTTLGYSADFIAVLFMYAVFVIALSYATAFSAQPFVTAQNVAVVYSLQVVFGILLAATLPSLLVQRIELTPAIVAGCLLICGGAITSEVNLVAALRRRRRVSREVPG